MVEAAITGQNQEIEHPPLGDRIADLDRLHGSRFVKRSRGKGRAVDAVTAGVGANEDERIAGAIQEIRDELAERLEYFRENGKLLEAQRLAARTRFDIEMLQEIGTCPGVENYSLYTSGRRPGEPLR